MCRRIWLLLTMIICLASCSLIEEFLYRDREIIAIGDVPIYHTWPPVFIEDNQSPDFFLTRGGKAQVIAFSGKGYPITTIRTTDGREGKIECGDYIVIDKSTNKTIWKAYGCKRKEQFITTKDN